MTRPNTIYIPSIRWGAFAATAFLLTFTVWGVKQMHSVTAIVTTLSVALLGGVILKESREEIAPIYASILSGYVRGCYVAAFAICVLVYSGVIVVGRVL